ncbi:MAG: diphthine--ammonia ligase [Candidatus Micrarchaeota archaeon]|nr:diphthine--ammonia ligase [Candidatus Micrarchaeota archaeon]
MKVAVLFSGGKDSVFAAFVCQQMGWEVVLVSILPAEYSTMFHFPNIKWCRLQAKRMGLEIFFAQPKGKTEEAELEALKNLLLEIKAEGVASGAIESEYQKERIDRIAYELGIPSFAPLWRKGEKLLSEQCNYLEIYLVAVAAEGLGKNDLAKRFDLELAKRLSSMKPTINPHLEGGEGETFVADAPFFRKKIKIKKWKKEFSGASGIARIVNAS